jgi:hypothetical protein
MGKSTANQKQKIVLVRKKLSNEKRQELYFSDEWT